MKLKILAVPVLVSMLIVATCTPVFSQTDIENAIKEIDRPHREINGDKLKPLPPEELPEIERKEEPEEPGAAKFRVTKIELTGVEAFKPEEFRPFVEKLENRDVTLDQLKSLAAKIEREYLKKGVIAACIVPPQEIKDGRVQLQVVEARMGEVRVQGNRFYRDKKLLSYWELNPGDILHHYRMSRSIQFMNKNADREVKATLHAGQKPGTTDILLSSETHFPLHFIGSFDKEGSASTGRGRTGVGAKHNNFLLQDDTLISGYMFGNEFHSYYVYHSLPVTSYGTSILYGYVNSKSVPKKEFANFNLYSDAQSVSVFLYQDIFLKDKDLGSVYVGVDAKDKRVRLNTGVLNRDRLRVVRAGGNIVSRGMKSSFYLKPEISQGLDFFGSEAESDLSSRGADNVFTKGKLSVRYMRSLPFNLRLSLKAAGQIANEKLMPQEEFSLGGIDSVRGYPSADYYADNGVQSSAELLYPPLFFLSDTLKLPFDEKPLKNTVTGIFFFDHGYGVRMGGEEGEQASQKMASIGTGLRIHLFDQVVVRLEWGFPVNGFGNDSLGEAGESRFHFSVDFEDKLLDKLFNKT